MKKIITILITVFLISCGDSSDTKKTDTTSSTTEAKDPDATKGLALITKSDCFTCHKLTENGTGPAYANIAAKYKVLDKAAMDSMVQQINKGGSGRWGTIPMPAHPQIPRADAELMVHYIMSITK